MQTFTIKGRFWKQKCFPDLNDYLGQATRSPYAANDMKKKYKAIASRNIRAYLRGWKTDKPVIIHYTFYECLDGHLRDVSNVVSMGVKVIEDALQDCKVIINDNPKYVRDYTHQVIYINKKEIPSIKVEIEELER